MISFKTLVKPITLYLIFNSTVKVISLTFKIYKQIKRYITGSEKCVIESLNLLKISVGYQTLL